VKSDIHPEYMDCEVVCGCGEKFVTRATVPQMRVEVCSKCHPFYTGKQRFVDSAGRVEKFNKRWGKTIEEKKSALFGGGSEEEQEEATEEQAAENIDEEVTVSEETGESESQ
jgi:large subunit ribosomal protein L31